MLTTMEYGLYIEASIDIFQVDRVFQIADFKYIDRMTVNSIQVVCYNIKAGE